MGLNIKSIITKKELEIKDLSGKILAVDTFNILYQFLTTIRQQDGTPLTNKKGEVTSHLNGLFFRTTNLMKQGLRPVFVFDGKAPDLKQKERKRRRQIKQKAQIQYEVAREAKDLIGMKKFASRTAYLTADMIAQAKELITLLGLPIVQAPSEGEAQAAHIVNQGHAYAAVSQDYDTLLYGCPRLIHNLSIVGRKKLPGKLAYKVVKPEMITLKELLKSLGIDSEQLLMLSILIGTDYNRGGVKGIGPKKALKLVKEYNDDWESMFSKVEFSTHSPHPWTEIADTFRNMPVIDEYDITFTAPKTEALKDFLVNKHDFSESRIENALKAIAQQKSKQEQTSLFRF